MSRLEKNDRDIDWSKISDGNGNYVLWVSSSGLIFSVSYLSFRLFLCLSFIRSFIDAFIHLHAYILQLRIQSFGATLRLLRQRFLGFVSLRFLSAPQRRTFTLLL